MTDFIASAVIEKMAAAIQYEYPGLQPDELTQEQFDRIFLAALDARYAELSLEARALLIGAGEVH